MFLDYAEHRAAELANTKPTPAGPLLPPTHERERIQQAAYALRKAAYALRQTTTPRGAK